MISGNGRHGVYVAWTFDELLIIHNLIGVNVNGDPLGTHERASWWTRRPKS